MEILIPIVIILLGCVFYGLSYLSPKTDVLIYGISAILFLVGGVIGLIGYNEVYLGSHTLTVVEEQINSDTTEYEITNQRNTEDVPFLSFLPIIFVLFSLYQFVVISTEFKNG